MKLSDAYKLAVKLLKRQAESNPKKTFTSPDGEKVTIADVADKLETVSKWVYPGLSSDDVTLVVRCKKCKFYKKFKKKGDTLKPKIIYACSKDMKPRDPMFFCGEGDPNDL